LPILKIATPPGFQAALGHNITNTEPAALFSEDVRFFERRLPPSSRKLRPAAFGLEVARFAAQRALLLLVRAVAHDVGRGAARVALRGPLAVAGQVPVLPAVVAGLNSTQEN